MKRILVAEDEDVIRDFVVINLRRSGYEVVDVPNGDEALRVFDENGGDFDICLLDIMMPGKDGFTVCKEIRKRSATVGIIMLSAKSQEMDKVGALMFGVTMFSAKPMENPDEVRSGPFVLNERSRTLTKNGKNIDLTQVEFQIMECFMKNPNVALERNSILSKVWGENYFGDVKIVDVNIRRLRMKIEDEPSNPKYLTTVWGFGYKWSVPE